MSQVTTWQPGEIVAFRRFNEMARKQALAIHAWDRADAEGRALGPRPVATPAADLQEIARRAA